jgi:hypothetical protein
MWRQNPDSLRAGVIRLSPHPLTTTCTASLAEPRTPFCHTKVKQARFNTCVGTTRRGRTQSDWRLTRKMITSAVPPHVLLDALQVFVGWPNPSSIPKYLPNPLVVAPKSKIMRQRSLNSNAFRPCTHLRWPTSLTTDTRRGYKDNLRNACQLSALVHAGDLRQKESSVKRPVCMVHLKEPRDSRDHSRATGTERCAAGRERCPRIHPIVGILLHHSPPDLCMSLGRPKHGQALTTQQPSEQHYGRPKPPTAVRPLPI